MGTTLGRGGEALERRLSALQEGRFAEAVVAFHAACALNAKRAALLNHGIAYRSVGEPHGAARALTAYPAHGDAEQPALATQGAPSHDRQRRIHGARDPARLQVLSQGVR